MKTSGLRSVERIAEPEMMYGVKRKKKPDVIVDESRMSLAVIAKHAGVSVATVSRVLNNSSRVRPRTAQLVRSSLQELRNSSSGGAVAAALRQSERSAEYVSGRTGAVALVFLGGGSVSDLQPIFIKLVSGIEEQLRQLGLRMVFSEVSDLGHIEKQLHCREIDGAVALMDSARANEQLLTQLASLVPTVRVMGMQTGPALVDHVVPHNWAIGQLAFDYLLGRGCKRVSYMFLPVWSQMLAGIQRMRALSFAMAARTAGVSVDFYWVGQDDEAAARIMGAHAVHTAATPGQLIDLYLAESRENGGLFLSTDQEMARLYPMLLERGVKPGMGFECISCDNETPLLASLEPRPATIDIKIGEIGRQAVLRLLRRIRHPEEPPLLIEVSPQLAAPQAGRTRAEGV